MTACCGPVVATAFGKSNGCTWVQLTVGGKHATLNGGSAVAQQALTISGMRWRLYGYLPR